jgi:hypothetical protein
MPSYYVLYCGIGVNYRRLMPGKKFLGESEAKARTKPTFSTTARYVNRISNKGLHPKRLKENWVFWNFYA